MIIICAGLLAATASAEVFLGPGCSIFPADHVWNARVDNLPLDPNSAAYVTTIGAAKGLHPDFGSGTWDGFPIGIPYVSVPGSQPKVPVIFDYADESDPGPYPIPAAAPIEGDPAGDGDRHMLIVDRDNGILYELYAVHQEQDGWHAGSGAIFDLNGYALRPDGWTSADAAGLAILPGLVRYEEVEAGAINHAIRFTAPQTRRAYLWPARHYASSLTGSNYPPMGQRFRLRADFDITGYSPPVQVILTALKRYGMILADNGAAWYLSGAPDERWDNDDLVCLPPVGPGFGIRGRGRVIPHDQQGLRAGPHLRKRYHPSAEHHRSCEHHFQTKSYQLDLDRSGRPGLQPGHGVSQQHIQGECHEGHRGSTMPPGSLQVHRIPSARELRMHPET